jgi:hypothetical protein
VHERDDANGEVESKYWVKIRNYLVEKSYMGVAMVGQPELQYYFHRPVSNILKYFFQNGFVVDAYEEPYFKEVRDDVRIFDNVFHNIPPALVCRLKLQN